MTNDIAAMLAERGRRYGDFMGHAQATMSIKKVITSHLLDRDKRLAPDQEEALHMIAHKIGRIINGDPDYEDSWRDVAGYATLVADRLRDQGQDPF